MRLLRRVLYLQAATAAVLGLSLVAAPGFVLHTLFGQARSGADPWVRVAGIEAFVLAMFMVLVAQRSEQVWWWSWAFVIATGAIAVVCLTTALVGPPRGSSPVLWWLLAAGNGAFAVALVWGLGRTGQERPLP